MEAEMAGRWKAATAVAAFGAVGVAVIAVAANAGGSGISFTSASASGSLSQWKVAFAESGLAPGSKAQDQMTAESSATFMCSDAPSYDHLGNPHGAPQHFRYIVHLSALFTGTADRHGVLKRTNAAPASFSPGLCSDGSAPSPSSFALYHVRINDVTHGIHTRSLRATTQPAPR
jgi:hypothetical protein